MKNLMLQILKKIIKILRAKWLITKPQKKFFLIYDVVSEPKLNKIVNKNECEILYTRYEKINFYVLFFTLFRSGFKNFKIQYKINFIKLVSPKFVITSIDNDTSFFELKNIYSKPCYICIQNGLRDNTYLLFKNNSNLSKLFNIDYFFVFGDAVKKKILENYKLNIITSGSILNNYHSSNYNQNNEENNLVLFISQFRSTMRFPENERIVFNILYNFCKKKNLELNILPKYNNLEKYYRKNLINGNWEYINKDNNSSYSFLTKFKMIVFIDSTLGYEAFSRGIKCACFPYGCLDENWIKKNQVIPPIPFGFPGDYKNVGPFWSNLQSDYTIEEILEKVFSYSNEEWKNITNKFISNVMQYDPGNSIINKIINKN